jgi:hypothetical protein
MKQQLVKCYLQNASVIHQMCGYGTGKTFEEAKQDALAICARQGRTNAQFDPQCGMVVFSDRVYL